jgi:AcrR family transcriptional regulator
MSQAKIKLVKSGKKASGKSNTPIKPVAQRAARRNTQSRQKFLASAEILIAEHGYEGTKIRAIAEHSGVNLGALHHYWGSKEELFIEVCNRRLGPMNEERMLRFDVLENSKNGKPVDIKELFKAAIEPTFFLLENSKKEQDIFRKFYGRVMTEPPEIVNTVMRKLFSPVSSRFFNLLRENCPHLSDDEFYWRATSILGTFIYAPAYISRIQFYAHKGFDVKDVSFGINQIVDFLAAGMLAPSSLPRKKAD